MIRQTAFSGQFLKKNLMKLLTDIRTDTDSYRYCSLILKAKQIINPSLNIPPTKFCENISTINEIFLQTKKMMYKSDSVNLECSTAKEILARLRNTFLCSVSTAEPSDTIEPLLSLLLGMKRYYGIYSEDYGLVGHYTIKRLITATDWFFISRGDTNSIFELPTPEQAVENLNSVQYKLAKYSSKKAEDLLSTVFHIGRTRFEFSDEEKKEIGALMLKAIGPIQMCIDGVSCLSKSTLSYVLQKRSSLQFLVDDCATYPTGDKAFNERYGREKEPTENETLRKDFYEDKINDSIKHVDNVIRNWWQMDNVSRVCCDNLVESKVDEKEVGEHVLDNDMIKWSKDANDLKEAGAYEVPESHIWWSDSIKNCINKNTN